MIRFNKLSILAVAALGFVLVSCDKDDVPGDTFDTSGTFTQNDQMGRPAVNTVFNGSADKNTFNVTTPSAMGAIFAPKFLNNLVALDAAIKANDPTYVQYSTNGLMQTAQQLTTFLATDVLNVKMTGPTTFYDGTNVLTGRNLTDDVIDIELTLIFGGPNALTGSPNNLKLISDNVGGNDKPFLTTFPFLAAPF
ncbi:MAG: DUF4331 family protein [Chitinophagaceae bacterium]|nr:DUF4331 family protein [Chitinophagaceae bacterium]